MKNNMIKIAREEAQYRKQRVFAKTQLKTTEQGENYS